MYKTHEVLPFFELQSATHFIVAHSSFIAELFFHELLLLFKHTNTIYTVLLYTIVHTILILQ